MMSDTEIGKRLYSFSHFLIPLRRPLLGQSKALNKMQLLVVIMHELMVCLASNKYAENQQRGCAPSSTMP